MDPQGTLGRRGTGVSCRQEGNMRNLTNHFENLTARSGLHCVWVPAQEGKGMPLVARWVETKEEAAERDEDEGVCAAKEEREPWPGMHLRAA